MEREGKREGEKKSESGDLRNRKEERGESGGKGRIGEWRGENETGESGGKARRQETGEREGNGR